MRSGRGMMTAAAAIGAVVLALAAAPAGAAPAYTQCTAVQGYTVYANGITCGTAKTLAKKLIALPLRGTKLKNVIIRSIPNYVCAANYNRKKKVTAGTCLKKGTVATGFGFLKPGATIPFPPGVDPGTAG